MDKQFWFAIRDNNYAVPEGQEVLALTEELFIYLGSPDPELRDRIAYEVFANWLDQGQYPPELVRAYILRLSANLNEGLGEVGDDSLYLRAFSVLCLAEIVNHDNQTPFLDRDETHSLLARGLAYLEAETDPRGYTGEKGWGHALAHTADLFLVLARSPHLHAADLLKLLNGISARLVRASNWIYVHGEDDRLARAALTALERDLLDEAAVQGWLKTLTAPSADGWKGAWSDEDRTCAYFNVRNFLRGLTLRTVAAEDLKHKDKLQSLLLEANANLKPY
jgi:hypothetical protein